MLLNLAITDRTRRFEQNTGEGRGSRYLLLIVPGATGVTRSGTVVLIEPIPRW